MARGAGSGQRWLIAAALVTQAAAHGATPPAQRSTAPAVAPEKDKKQTMEENTAPANAPDAALLEYLGRYADAGDGIDPLSFATPDATQPPPSAQAQGEL